MPWLAGWKYRLMVPVTNKNSVPLEKWYWDAALNLLELEGAQPDFSDVRVTLADGVTPAPFMVYFVNSFSPDGNMTTGRICSCGPVIQASSYNNLYIYWGSEADGQDDPEGLFDFFDNHNDNQVDPAKWTTIGAVSEIDSDFLQLAHTGTLSLNALSVPANFGPGFDFWARVKIGACVPYSFRRSMFGFYSSEGPWANGDGIWFQHVDNRFEAVCRSNDSVQIFTATINTMQADTWHLLRIEWRDDSVTWIVDDAVVAEISGHAAIPAEAVSRAGYFAQGMVFPRLWNDWVDWIGVKETDYTGGNEPIEVDPNEIIYQTEGGGSVGDMVEDIAFRLANPHME